MLKKDLASKLAEQLAKALSEILSLKEKALYDKGHKAINNFFQEILGVNPEILNLLPHDDFIEMMCVSGPIGKTKCIAAGELLKEEGDIWRLEGNREQSRQKYLKALDILIIILGGSGKNLAEKYFSKIEELVFYLKETQLSVQTYQSLLSYYEEAGKFAKVEDLLFQLIEEYPELVKQGFIEKGLAFYQRLLKKDNCQLEEGNLPKNEVIEGLENFKQAVKKIN